MSATKLVDEKRAEKASASIVIDTDVHENLKSIKDLVPYLQEPWRRLVADGHFSGLGSPYATWNAMRDAEPPSGVPAGSDLEYLRKHLLDSYSITKAVLTGYFYPAVMQMQFEFATALARAYNDWMLENWLARDDRFLGSVHVAPQIPTEAAREIDRLGSHPRVVQVMLPVVEWPYGDPFYHPIFEAAERNNLRVAFHQSRYVKGALGVGRTYVERHMVFPESAMAMLASLYCNGVFDKYPGVHFVFVELGFTWLNHVLWRYDKEYRSLQQEIPWVKRLASDYFLERVRFTTQPLEDITARQLSVWLELVGSDDILMFSSDYPHFDFDSPTQSLPPGLSESTRAKIMYKNASNFYELDY